MSGFHTIDPELYREYKDRVLELSNSHQTDINEFLSPEHRQRGLSDDEIGEKLGLDPRDVTEIRVVAERDSQSLDDFRKASEFKDKAASTFAKSGLSHIFKPDYEV